MTARAEVKFHFSRSECKSTIFCNNTNFYRSKSSTDLTVFLGHKNISFQKCFIAVLWKSIFNVVISLRGGLTIGEWMYLQGPQFGSLPPVVMKLAVLNCDAFCDTLLGTPDVEEWHWTGGNDEFGCVTEAMSLSQVLVRVFSWFSLIEQGVWNVHVYRKEVF